MALANIDRGIGKAASQEDTSQPGRETCSSQSEKSSMTNFKRVLPARRRAGTGCITQINDRLFESRYSLMWINGKKRLQNVYAHACEECKEKLKVPIKEMKAELPEIKNKRRSPKPHPGYLKERRDSEQKRSKQRESPTWLPSNQ